MQDKFIVALAEALEMEESEINFSDHFRDYESYDSLAELSVLAMLDADFGVELEMKEYNTFVTVEDLFKRVSAKN
ncbi:acyl carrier protein [Saccharicrinis fermentans]|uniref:Carrier domain-containing protein n=1 Tax=Saccharicrinis fermentans DSM 9555 = JCM 21142 TaxID=869213 RepID=W7Y5A6_9BACT|nr:acyl carrier protein [Saccharicrinis fermentans]GAF03267.1 hypothetical protein JCM21142_41934 [Saccharicrinis fermentans DSM 9555 = JCM 21142]